MGGGLVLIIRTWILEANITGIVNSCLGINLITLISYLGPNTITQTVANSLLGVNLVTLTSILIYNIDSDTPIN